MQDLVKRQAIITYMMGLLRKAKLTKMELLDCHVFFRNNSWLGSGGTHL